MLKLNFSTKWARLAAFFLFLWVAFVVFFPTPLERPEVSTKIEKSSELYSDRGTSGNFGMVKARFYETVEDKSRWKISSEFAELHRHEDYAFLTTVVAEFTSAKSGNRVLTTSQFGRTYLSKKTVELNGDVQINSRQGYRFYLDNLTYSGRTREFRSSDWVRMEGPEVRRPRMKLKGQGLVGNADTEMFQLKKNVQADRRMGQSNDWLKITAQQGEFYTGEQRSHFSGKVKALMPKMAVDCDKLKLLLSGDKEDIEAKGNVKLVLKNRTAYADSASLQIGGNRILLQGRARVESKENQIKGRKILLFTDEDRLEVEGAEGGSRS